MSKFVKSLRDAMENETNGTPFWNPAVANMAQEDRDAILAFQKMYVSPGGYQRVHQVNYDREDITDQVYFGGTNKADSNEPAANEPAAKKAAANEPVAKKADEAATEEPDILNPDDDAEEEWEEKLYFDIIETLDASHTGDK